MPRRGAAALLLTTAALALLLSFKTPSDPNLAAGSRATAAGGSQSTPAPAATRPRATTPAATPAPAATGAPVAANLRDGTVDGAVVDTRWGTVQVEITVSGGAITDVTALQLPSRDRHSADISRRVEPLLRTSALAVQGAQIDVVSGATYTSLAYAQSLQAALDAARA
jgi:uncharacterized protein with FMN-binding domain